MAGREARSLGRGAEEVYQTARAVRGAPRAGGGGRWESRSGHWSQ